MFPNFVWIWHCKGKVIEINQKCKYLQFENGMASKLTFSIKHEEYQQKYRLLSYQRAIYDWKKYMIKEEIFFWST